MAARRRNRTPGAVNPRTAFKAAVASPATLLAKLCRYYIKTVGNSQQVILTVLSDWIKETQREAA